MEVRKRIGLTGTPGTGKTSLGKILSAKYSSYSVVHLNDLVNEIEGVIVGRDVERETDEIDVNILDAYLVETFTLGKRGNVLFLEGHLAHLLTSENIIVLRCHPAKLRERLSKKGWTRKKVDENVEAETLDVITIEAVEKLGSDLVSEIDTTELTTIQVAQAVHDIVTKGFKTHRAGNIDWSATLMEEPREDQEKKGGE